MKKREKSLDTYVEILTYVWLKCINNHETSNNVIVSAKNRRSAGERCEKLQRVRQKIIRNINDIFNEKIQ
jgi:hypothetical protein